MTETFQQLVDAARELRMKGTDAKAARRSLIKDGWDVDTIDRALWQVGLRDVRNIFFIKRAKKAAIILGSIGVFTGVVTATLYFEDKKLEKEAALAARTQDEIIEAEYLPVEPMITDAVVSKGASITFDLPKAWESKSQADADVADTFGWQIEPPSNTAVRAQLTANHGDLDTDNLEAIEAYLNDPLAGQLVSCTITVNLAPSFNIEPTLDDWKIKIDGIQNQFGYTATDFEKLTIDGVEGYTYISSVKTEGVETSTRDYVFLTEGRRVEVSTFPVLARRQKTFDAIIESITFN